MPVSERLLHGLSRVLRVNGPSFGIVTAADCDFGRIGSVLAFGRVIPPTVIRINVGPLSFGGVGRCTHRLEACNCLGLQPRTNVAVNSLFFSVSEVGAECGGRFRGDGLDGLRGSVLQRLYRTVGYL